MQTEHETSERRLLLQLARDSIAHGMARGQALSVEVAVLPAPLRQVRATFVTLLRGGVLRGCIGTLEAYRPLAEDVAQNAYASAFSDPRFPAMTATEMGNVEVSISVLGPATPMTFADELDLCAQLRPGVDGVIIELGQRRATFLPSVWESLPQPRGFFAALKHKARLMPGEDLSSLKAWRYATESFGDREFGR